MPPQDLTLPCMMCIIPNYDTHRTREAFMRTNIIIDDNLMSEALQVSGYRTKKEADKSKRLLEEYYNLR